MRTALVAFALLSCGDPVPDGQISALPPENPLIPVGEFHRAGQPCVLCHNPSGPASGSPFAVAGTIFAQPENAVGVEAATVAMTDAMGSQFTVTTNCVGNFFVPQGTGPMQWDPEFPIFVRVWNKSGATIRTMQGQIGRERSCANCHNYPQTGSPQVFSSVGHVSVYLATDTPPPPATDCPMGISPVLK